MAQVRGLDIGTSAVRAAELDLGSSPPTLLAFGQIGIPPGTIIDGEIQDPTRSPTPSDDCGATGSSLPSPW